MLLIAGLLIAAALPAAALASRAPSSHERTQLRKAVTASKLVPPSVRRGHFKLVSPRISKSGQWARSGIAPTNSYIDPFGAPKGLFKHRGKGWRLVDIGTSGVGCSKPRLPRAVRKDLQLRCG
jgi:hypothetical protein